MNNKQKEEQQKIQDFMQVLNYLKTAGKANEFTRAIRSGEIKCVWRIE